MKCSLIAALVLAVMCGCNKAPDPQEKLAEAQKELEAAQQRVAAAEAEAAKTVTAKGEPAPAEPAPSLAKTVAPAAPKAAVKAEPKPVTVTLPAGTAIPIRTTSTISTKTHQGGDAFAATLTKDLVVDGKMLATKGAEVSGVVADSDPGGRVKGRASISLRVRSIAGVQGPIAVETGSYMAVAKSTVKRDVVRGGIMAGAGAAIGAIAGGAKGAAIGAGAGGAAGAGTAAATRGDPATVAAESVVTVKTTAPVTVTLQP